MGSETNGLVVVVYCRRCKEAKKIPCLQVAGDTGGTLAVVPTN